MFAAVVNALSSLLDVRLVPGSRAHESALSIRLQEALVGLVAGKREGLAELGRLALLAKQLARIRESRPVVFESLQRRL